MQREHSCLNRNYCSLRIMITKLKKTPLDLRNRKVNLIQMISSLNVPQASSISPGFWDQTLNKANKKKLPQWNFAN